jgi:hypothetical protein
MDYDTTMYLLKIVRDLLLIVGFGAVLFLLMLI